MKKLNLIRVSFVLMLAFGFLTAPGSIATAHDAGPDTARYIDDDTFAGNNDLVEQLVQVLIDILNELLNGDDLEDLLPEGCGVTVPGFTCSNSSTPASLFLSANCVEDLFGSGYLCTVADVVYSCTAHKVQNQQGESITMICIAP